MKILASLLIGLIFSLNTANAQLKYGSEISGNAVIPVSSDAFSTGFGGTLGLFFDLQTNMRVTMSGGYWSVGVDEAGIKKLYKEAGGTFEISPRGSMKAIPLLVGLQLITPGPLQFYGALEAGIYIYNVDVSWTQTNAMGQSSDVQAADETRTEFGVNLGFGALFPVRENMAITAGAKYHFVRTSEFRSTAGGASNMTLSTDQLLTFALGLNWSFPS